MRYWIALALAASLTASAAAAQSVPERRAHGIQCLLAMAAANGAAPNATAAAAARVGMMFFAAQLFGMDPNIDLAAAARPQLPALSKQRLETLVHTCGAEMNARERQIAAMGARLRPGK